MPIGKPDWSEQQQVIDYLGSSDLNEIGVRLGAYPRYYRGGNIIFHTAFNDTDDFVKLTNGGGTNLLDISSNASLVNHQSLRSITRPAAASNTIDKTIPYIESDYISLVCALALDAMTTNVIFDIKFFNGTTVTFAKLEFDSINDEISILGAVVGNYVIRDYPTITTLTDKLWVIFKLQVNLADDKYYNFNLAGTDFDISSIVLNSAASTLHPHTELIITHEVPAADQSVVFIDDLYITINDPL